MGHFLGLPEVLETDYEDDNHFGLVGPKKVLRFVYNLVVPQNGHSTTKHSVPFRGTTRLHTNHSNLLGPTKLKRF